MLSHKSHKLSSLFIILFPFCSSNWMNSMSLSLISLILSSVSFLRLLSSPIEIFSYCILQFCVLSGTLYILYLFVETLKLFMHCSLGLSEHSYGHYFELPSVKSLISHFIKICFWRFLLFFCSGQMPVSSFSLMICVVFFALGKTAASPALTVWFHTGNELDPATPP